MSAETRELIEICEKLPPAQREEVTDFARSLLTRSNGETGLGRQAAERWLTRAVGTAKPGVTTDQVMALTRGES
jgi:hypothetical protein